MEFFKMQYSIIFMVDHENPDFYSFIDTVCEAFQGSGLRFEVLIVANGVEDFVKAQLGRSAKHVNDVKVITFNRPVSQSACLQAALKECSGANVMVTGSSQELAPESYRKLIATWDSQKDVVIPYRKVRRDPLFNRLHSRMLNKMLQDAVGIDIHDIGCQVRIFRREVLDQLEIYGNMHRYLPLLAAQKGFKIHEVECDQLNRPRQTRYYNYKMYLNRLTEILNLFFSAKFSRKPLRFFNLLGSILMGAGATSLLYIGIQKILYNIPIGSRPLLILALVALVTGAQIASFGLLGEIIAFIHGRYRKEYTIEKII